MIGGVMNAFNQSQLADDNSGLLESCDWCNCLIHHWDLLNRSWIMDNGQVICNSCHREYLINSLTTNQDNV